MKQPKLGIKNAPLHVVLNLGDKDWYDMWHVHLDIYGNANISHRDLITAGLAMYRQFCKQAKNLSKPWQSWVVIDPNDAGQDAVYFHTPNPNRDNFPYTFESVYWGAKLPELLEGLIDSEEFAVGMSDYNDELLYWIQRKI